MKYKSNNNVIYSCKYHVVFCPKYRRPVLVDGVDDRLKELIKETCDQLNVEIIEMENHARSCTFAYGSRSTIWNSQSS